MAPLGRLPLAFCGIAAALPAAVVGGGNEQQVRVYFGCGCFWRAQHELWLQETSLLHRSGPTLTARTAYAGGKKAGPGGLLCYHNEDNIADYGVLGHSEVVLMDLPESSFPDFAAAFWAYCPEGQRYDFYDVGGEYRSVIGLPGGMGSPLVEQLRAKAGNVTLVAGQGNDGDTLNLQRVFVYDTGAFPATVAEKCYQFHDDQTQAYGKAYNDLRKFANKTKCPCDTGAAPVSSGEVLVVE
eukprot:CAMPEP_0197900380 /NCGR_PEP_ID=MMETSP1439-20131203/48939_1 /TAXON_ID=66791 /ORGANISM="Gonyaulax spinifera, Strain CCMP409" /LENGTH=239 /DNA_ID=CAMNT_0043521261 /DNA_START=36 /DNA_END=753 /DNA_ORIENTATION=-